MERDSLPGAADLRFFGAVGASISHEMKNVLAIINEMVGLLDDLSRMAATGRPLEPERLQSMTGRMQAQVARGDGIMRGLNRFCHSVDRPRDTLDLTDLTGFVADLAKRRAALREVTLETPPPPQPQRVTANAFALEHLIWACLERAIALADRGATLVLRTEAGPAGPRVRITGLTPAGPTAWAAIPDEGEGRLAERLGATLSADPAAGELILSLPELG
jgi:C4-dicarboxylate-specific signal transduction histidine kinase